MNKPFKVKINRKKYIAFIGLSFLIFCAGILNTKAQTSNVLEPLHTFEEFFQIENLSVSEWQILMREHVIVEETSESAIKEMITNFVKDATIQVEENEHSIKYFTEYLHKDHNFSEKVSIVQEKGNEQSLQLYYVITGNETTKNYENSLLFKINRANSQYFTKNPSIFTCMKAKSNAIIKSKFIVDKFQRFTNMEMKSSLNESSFTTVSGFIQDLNSEVIPISENDNMNIQLAVRDVAEEGTTITLGTPILTVEY